MIAKVITGKSFGGCIRYLLEREQSAVLDSSGVRDYDIRAITSDLNAQRKMRPQLGNAVGHTVLSWSNEDREKLTLEKMAAHAREYMQKMGIKNTQYVTVLHTDRHHPHLHIVYNRVDNDGQTIGNFNHWHKSRKICREMTERYGYHLGKGKEWVNRQALRGSDRLRYAIYDALRSSAARANSWAALEKLLARQGITILYKYRSGTEEVQGISFEKDGVKFKGSAIDRRFSYAGLDRQLNANAAHVDRGMSQRYEQGKSLGEEIREVLENSISQTPSNVTSTVGSILSELLRVEVVTPEPDPMEEAERRRRKRLKQQAKGRSSGMSR